jgi:hypothetical protein
LNPVELALEKQRLQLEAASQRMDLSRHMTGLLPVFDVADRVRDGLRWSGRHPEIVAGGVALLAAARPGVRHFIWRWGKRALIVWHIWRNGGERGFWLVKPPI